MMLALPPMMNYREATVADIPTLAAIRLMVTENTLTDPTRITRGLYHENLTTAGKGWVCEVDRTVVGFVVALRDAATIWALFVHPGHEGRGIGKTLLKTAVDWLFEVGAEEVALTTDPGTRAEKLYVSQGWERGEYIDNGEVRYRLRRTVTGLQTG